MEQDLDTDVLVIGGGPVGLLTAAWLSQHSVKSYVIERRGPGEAREVKCNHVSARSMEAFRRLGIADQVRSSGLPSDHPHDVAFRTSVTGREFGRIRIPSASDRVRGEGVGPDTAWSTPEPPHRINQMYLNPILEGVVQGFPDVELMNSTECLSIEQYDSHVAVHVVNRATNELRTLKARYLVGADGGRSLVRKTIGGNFYGDPVLQHVQSTYVRAPRLYAQMRGERAWGYYVFAHHRQGHVYAIDGEETFLIHTYLSAEEAEQGGVDRDQTIRNFLGTGVEYEILSKEDWTARRLVADRFRDGRLFIAGDSAHLWVPMGGYGMNAGIADGINLAWLLSAVIDGWADPSVLDAYEAERQPITEQVSKFAMSHLEKLSSADIPSELDADDIAGQRSREKFSDLVYQLNVQQFAASGLNFGYSYSDSPIIVSDGVPPRYMMGTYNPSTVPGCRLPHVWMSDGSSLYDHLGPWYTLIVVGDEDRKRISEWVADAHMEGLPIEIVRVGSLGADVTGVKPFLIVREDQHIVWRGSELPTEVAELAQKLGVRGSVKVCEERAA